MGRGAKWSCLLEKMMGPERALRDARIVVLFTTLTKAALAVNEPTEWCCEKPNAEISEVEFRFDASAKGRGAS